MDVITLSVQKAVENAPGAVGDLLAVAKFEPDAEKRTALVNAAHLMRIFTALGMHILKTTTNKEDLEATVIRMAARYLEGPFGTHFNEALAGPDGEWIFASRALLRIARSAPDLPALKEAVALLENAPPPVAVPHEYVYSIASFHTVAGAILEGWMDWSAFDGPLNALEVNGYENW